MLPATARLVARTARMAAPRTAPRAMSSVTTGGSPKEVELEDVQRIEPGEWFKELDDNSIRAQLSKLLDIENDLMAKVSQESKPVDWDHWRSVIKHPGLVDELKEIHENTPVPDVEAEKMRIAKEAEQTFNPIIAELERLAKESEAETEQFEKRAAEIKYLRDNLAELPIDEFLERYPSVKASIEDDIANNRWFVNE